MKMDLISKEHKGRIKIKRLVAIRKLKRKCVGCEQGFEKGRVYYKKREVYDDPFGGLCTFEYLWCSKCKFKKENQKIRFEKFKPNCHHPIVSLEYSYIPGEAVMEPDHNECRICRKWI